MNEQPDVTKKQVARAIIEKINSENDQSRIFTDYFPGYHSPQKITSSEDHTFKPDIAAIKNKTINIYEIELEKTDKKDKWELFSDYALNNNGNLFIIIPEVNGKRIKQLLQNLRIKANIIYFNV